MSVLFSRARRWVAAGGVPPEVTHPRYHIRCTRRSRAVDDRYLLVHEVYAHWEEADEHWVPFGEVLAVYRGRRLLARWASPEEFADVMGGEVAPELVRRFFQETLCMLA